MNERIRELAVQSGMSKLVDSWEYERFAELIVQECLAQVDKVDEMLEDDSEKAGVAWVGYAIEKHFGVKE